MRRGQEAHVLVRRGRLAGRTGRGRRGRHRGAGAGAHEALRRVHGRRRGRFRHPRRRGLRLPRPERRRQDLDDAHDRLSLADLGRDAAGTRARSDARRSADTEPDRPRSPGRHPRSRAHRAGQPLSLRALLRSAEEGAARACRPAARVRAPHRPRRRAGGPALGRHASPAHDRPGTRVLAGPRHPRRADDRPRSRRRATCSGTGSTA